MCAKSSNVLFQEDELAQHKDNSFEPVNDSMNRS